MIGNKQITFCSNNFLTAFEFWDIQMKYHNDGTKTPMKLDIFPKFMKFQIKIYLLISSIHFFLFVHLSAIVTRTFFIFS